MWLESGTSESDLAPIGVGLYGDNLRRLDGGIDHDKHQNFPNVWEQVQLTLLL